MIEAKHNSSKRDFIRRSIAISTGLLCFPCSKILPELSSDQKSNCKRIAMYQEAAAGCNFACLNCQNWTISQTSPDKTRSYDLPPADVVASNQ